MDILIMAGQLILGLSILVGLHELGHLVAAKVFGMRVEQYSIGFPPKLFGFKYGETEYSLGAVPLGGYVKISGMVDESLDTAGLSEEPKPYEFRAKPAWQRLIVMMGGILVNVITGIIIFIILLYAFGRSYLPASEAKYGIVAGELAQKIGLRTGDKIVAINGQSFDDFNDIMGKEVLLENGNYYTVERDGKTFRVDIPDDLIGDVGDKRESYISALPVTTFTVDTVPPPPAPGLLKGFLESVGLSKPQEASPAHRAGLQSGDKIVRVNDQPIRFYHELQAALAENKNKKVTLGVERDGKPVDIVLTVPSAGKIGFAPEFPLQYKDVDYSLGEAVQEGPAMAFGVVKDNIRAFGKIFGGQASLTESVSGPIGIAKFFGGTWVWERFWYIVGLLSMILAFMNFLPIPALDGGHVMFLMYEIVSGRSPSDRFLEVAQKVGMVILLSLMVFAIANDTFKIFQSF